MKPVGLFLAALVSLALLLTISGPAPTYSQTTLCDQIVYDEASALGSGAGSVKGEIDRLTSIGVNARVFVLRTTKPDSIKQYADKLKDRCSSWRSLDGGARNNFVLIVVAISDRQTGILYGDEWKKTLDPRWEKIIDDRMNPRFRDGDYAGGITNGLKEINRLLSAQINPPSSQPGGTTVVEVQKEPTDFSGLWFVLKILAIALIVGVGGFFGYRILSDMLKARSRRQTAQRSATQVKNSAVAQINAVSSRLPEVETMISVLSSSVSPADCEEMTAKVNKAKRLLSNAAIDLRNNSDSRNDPETGGLSEEDYDQIESAFAAILETAKEAETCLNEADSLRRSLMKDLAELPQRLEEAGSNISETEGSIPAVVSQGFRTDQISSGLTEAKRLLSEAREMFAQKNLGGTRAKIAEALALRESCHDQLLTLPQRRDELTTRLNSLKAAADRAANRIVEAKAVYDELDAKHPDSSLETIGGNGAESVKHLDTATDLILEAESKASMETQDWDRAETALAQAEKEIEKVNSLLNSVFKLKQSLEIAQASAGEEINAAKADLERAQSYILSHDEDLPESHERNLGRATQSLAQAEEEIGKNKPDYLQVVRLAQEANASADNILASARTEVEALERQRALAASSLRDAQIAISLAEEYYEDHDEDIDEEVGRRLARTKRDLEESERTSDLALKIQIAQRARLLADQMLEESEDSFREAEEERESAQNQSSGWGHSGGLSGGYSSHGSSGGLSGGFGGFGGSGSFGGGSKGW